MCEIVGFVTKPDVYVTKTDDCAIYDGFALKNRRFCVTKTSICTNVGMHKKLISAPEYR